MTKPNKNSALKGATLIEMAFFIVVGAMMLTAGAPAVKYYLNNKDSQTTDNSLIVAQNALDAYYQTHQRYPCPAPRNVALDTAAYGQEDTATACTTALTGVAADLGDGTVRTIGPGGKPIRIGALPVRTLGLPDSGDVDGYGHRLLYAVTENYATANAPSNMNSGAIAIQDSNGNSSITGSAVYIVIALGADPRGAYNSSGTELQPCAPASVPAGKNCSDTNANGTFISTLVTSNAGAGTFTSKAVYRAGSGKTCTPQTATGFTSGSGYPIQLTGLTTGQSYTIPVTFTQINHCPCVAGLWYNSFGFYLTSAAGVIKNVTLLVPDANPTVLAPGTQITTTLNVVADGPTIGVGLFMIPGGAKAAFPPFTVVNNFTPLMLNSLEFDNPVTGVPANIHDTVPPILNYTNAAGVKVPVISYDNEIEANDIYHANGNLNPGQISRFLRPDEICSPAEQAADTLVGPNHDLHCGWHANPTSIQQVGIDPVNPMSLDFGFEDWYWFFAGMPAVPNNSVGFNIVSDMNTNLAFQSPSCYEMPSGTCIGGLPDPALLASPPIVDYFGGYVAKIGDYNFDDLDANIAFQTCQ